jgi:hypothetical protein
MIIRSGVAGFIDWLDVGAAMFYGSQIQATLWARNWNVAHLVMAAWTMTAGE